MEDLYQNFAILTLLKSRFYGIAIVPQTIRRASYLSELCAATPDAASSSRPIICSNEQDDFRAWPLSQRISYSRRQWNYFK